MTQKIALLQFNPVRKNVQKNILEIQTMLTGIKADMIVLPELSNSGYLYDSSQSLLPYAESQDDSSPFLSALINLAGETGGIIISGYAERVKNKIFNSAIAVSSEGIIENYRKIHLYDAEKTLFQPGDTGFPVFDWLSVKIGMMICFDWIFPEAARSLSLSGAQIIAHPANLVLPYCQDAMVTRSIENKVFTITANRIGSERLGEKKLRFTGKSQITDPQGRVLYRGPEDKATVHVLSIDPQDALDKSISDRNDIMVDRRPSMYINKQ